MALCSLIGMMFVSLCRWSWFDMTWHHIIARSSIVWCRSTDGFVSYGKSFFIFTPTASSKRLQDVRPDLHLVLYWFTMCTKRQDVIKRNSKYFGRVTDGICWLSMTRSSWVLTSLVQVVKSVAVDFSGEISSLLDTNQLCTTGRKVLNFGQIKSVSAWRQ